jgi:hypothetical protein
MNPQPINPFLDPAWLAVWLARTAQTPMRRAEQRIGPERRNLVVSEVYWPLPPMSSVGTAVR